MDRTLPRLASLLALLALAGCACGIRVEPTVPEGGPNLGYLPASLNLRWPAQPETDTEVFIRSEQDLGGPVTVSRVRLVLEGPLDELVIAADDVEVAAGESMRVGRLLIRQGSHRVRLEGGRYGSIVIEAPSASSSMVEDVTLDRVIVEDGDPALAIRGVRRLALIESRVESRSGIAFFVGDTGPLVSEDVSIVDSVIDGESRTAGALHDVHRVAVVDSWLESDGLFAASITGSSDHVVLSRNTLVGGGLAVGDGRSGIGSVWVALNTLYSRSQLASLETDDIEQLLLAHNTVYSDVSSCMWCGETPPSWTVRPNLMLAYRTPPSRLVRP